MTPLLLLSLRQLGGRWRLLIILLLALLPVALAVLVAALARDESDYAESFENILLDGMLVGAILPIVILALATAAFGIELEDHTLSYLVLKPIARWRIVLPKLLAAVLVGGPIMVASGVAAALLGLEGDLQAALAVAAALTAGVLAYAAIFTWAGLMSGHALGFGLVYVFLWEGLISSFLSGVRYLSVRGYALAIMSGANQGGFEALEGRVIELPAAIVGTVGVTVVFFWLAVRRLRRMDVS